MAATTYMPRHESPTRADELDMAQQVKRSMGLAGFMDITIEELPLNLEQAACILGVHP